MPKDGYINARVDKSLKKEAETVLRKVGLTTTDAVSLLLHQVVLRQGLPFEAKVPNAETRAAMAELDAGKGSVHKGTTKDILKGILKDAD